ncbi:MAG: S1 family peptidase [Labilithrix sp.]
MTLLLACSCSLSGGEASDGAGNEPTTTSTASAIVNGSVDTTHSAVVTVVSDAAGNEISICTGTIVKTDPARGIGWVATAAHCIADGAPRAVWEGSDYLARDRVRHNVVAYAADTRFDITKPESGYDFAVIRISGVTASTPVIPLASAPDQLSTGTAMDNVGFGRTTKPPATSDTNSKRHIVSTSLGHVTELLLAYDAAEKGACQGDSGGPWLVGSGADVRVVGIDSYGNTTCDGLAVAGRVQAGLDFFSAELGDTVPDRCELCKTLAQSSGGKCAKATSAGLSTCVCSTACVDQCKDSTECASGPACTGDGCTPTTPDPGASAAPESDAGPTVVVVHKKGDGCNAAPGTSSPASGLVALAGIALACRVRRRRR